MPDILIRNLSNETIMALDVLAKAKGMSRQDMLKEHLEILADPYQKALFHGHTVKEIQAIVQQEKHQHEQRDK